MNTTCRVILLLLLFTTVYSLHALQPSSVINKGRDSLERRAMRSNSPKDTLLSSAPSNFRLADFVPTGFVLQDSVFGDLNNDGLPDCILVIKDTQASKRIVDKDGRTVDQNRRGVVVLLKTSNSYTTFVCNRSCFASEQEDGGAYYAPDLEISIVNNTARFCYQHGRYGSWCYIFRYRSADMELIEFHRVTRRGPDLISTLQVDFLRGTSVKTTFKDSEGDERKSDTLQRDKTSRVQSQKKVKGQKWVSNLLLNSDEVVNVASVRKLKLKKRERVLLSRVGDLEVVGREWR